jgi:hypothetical protein
MTAAAAASSAATKPATSAGRMPVKLSVRLRAGATAGLAKDMELVNQLAAMMWRLGEEQWRRLHLEPMSLMCFWIAMRSSLSSGRLVKTSMRRRSAMRVSRKALRLASSLPCTAAGSGRPQWAVMG